MSDDITATGDAVVGDIVGCRKVVVLIITGIAEELAEVGDRFEESGMAEEAGVCLPPHRGAIFDVVLHLKPPC
jgi:hypothetical protein